MDKYIVNVHINKVDENKNSQSESFDYEFESEPLELIEARRKAIKKAKDLIEFFDNELPDSEFSTIEEAEKKSYKGYNSYSVSIILSTEDEPYNQVYGNDISEQLDWLEYEYQYFTNTHNIVKLMKVEYEMNNFEIIEEDSAFMMGL
jgi:hypothetical protein